jgi:3-hydroxyacyl-CoA dehydrogenase
MGAGIAEVLARAGLKVTAVEADPDAPTRGIAVIEAGPERLSAPGGRHALLQPAGLPATESGAS